MRFPAQNAVFSVPVKNGGTTRTVRICSGGHFLLLNIAYTSPEEADLRMDYPLPFPYRETMIESPDDLLPLLRWKSECDPCSGYRDEPHRQQFHFTPKRGWMNDPNGMYFYRGVWHLFFQYNPLNICWENMHWSHAESNDLVHWRETGIVLYPDDIGTIFSGSAFIDSRNAAGFGKDAILLYYTNYSYDGRGTQNLAYSLDGGKTFQKYERNPLIPNLTGNCDRDPVIEYDPDAGFYRMAFYLGTEASEYALFASRDLLHWERTDTYKIPGGIECPGLTRMKDEATGQYCWVFWAANSVYLTGKITPRGKVQFCSGPRRFLYGDAYAGQRFFCTDPGSPMIFLAWIRVNGGTYAGSMTYPMELHLSRGELRVKPVHPVHGTEAIYRGSADFSLPGRHAVLDLKEKTFLLDGTSSALPNGLTGTLHGTLIRDRLTMEFFEKEGRFALILGTR